MRRHLPNAAAALVLLSLACAKSEQADMYPDDTQAHPSAHTATASAADTALGPTAIDSAAQAATAFVQAFYSWYATRANNLETAVTERPALFGSALLAALRLDLEASRANPGAMVGLTWDPLTGGQEPCDPYRVVRTARRGDTVLVDVRSACPEYASRDMPDAVPLLLHVDSDWRIVDVRHGTDAGTLLADLARLRDARAAGAAPSPD